MFYGAVDSAERLVAVLFFNVEPPPPSGMPPAYQPPGSSRGRLQPPWRLRRMGRGIP